MTTSNYSKLASTRAPRARAIAQSGGIEQAIGSGELPQYVDITLSEAIVLGLLRQGVHKYISVFGHGSTEVAEVLRVYEAAGLVKTYNVRSEIEAAHAAHALRWVTGEKAAVITSIGPGALQALAASLAAASDGIGVWHLYGDETTEDEGPNMQQIPKERQSQFQQLCQTMGETHCLHTPWSIGTALRRGLNRVDHPSQAGPFYLMMPMNTQAAALTRFNLDELPTGSPPRLGATGDEDACRRAAEAMLQAARVVVRIGGGARESGAEIQELLELIDAVAVTSPIVPGVVPHENPRNMTVAGSKGSLCGNYAMEQADLLVAIGTRFVCQSDSSRTAYPNVKQVVNISADLNAALHYNKTIALVGDARLTLKRLIEIIKSRRAKPNSGSAWFAACKQKRDEWEQFKQERYNTPCLHDEAWKSDVLTQPMAIKVALDWARANDAVCFFDAGDVQANGFQIVEDEKPGRTFTETGASYMGFAASALLASAIADKPFFGMALSGDGSFTMNPQILIDGVQHGAHGCIVLFDNRRMAAISGLQVAQYGEEYATNDQVEVDYVAWAKSVKGVAAFSAGNSVESLKAALDSAHMHKGMSLVHVPVYHGPDPLGGMGVFGRWNVGNWCEDVQKLRHEIGL